MSVNSKKVVFKISERSLEPFVRKIEWLMAEYRKVASADDSRTEEAIGETAFPLLAHSQAATAACGEPMFLFPRMMAEYSNA